MILKVKMMAAEEEMQETDWLQKGMTVEMRSDQEGYVGAWFKVQIIELLTEELRHKKKKKNRVCRQVVVEHLVFTESDEPGSKKHQETVKKDYLRPLPPELSHKQWKKRDAVETWHGGAWWIGFIKRKKAKNDTYLVYYGRGYKDLEIAASDIRSRQVYVRSSSSWSVSAAMQTPADWEKNKETRVVKTQSKAKGTICYKRRESNYSQDEDWDEDEDKRKKKPRLVVTIGKHR